MGAAGAERRAWIPSAGDRRGRELPTAPFISSSGSPYCDMRLEQTAFRFHHLVAKLDEVACFTGDVQRHFVTFCMRPQCQSL